MDGKRTRPAAALLAIACLAPLRQGTPRTERLFEPGADPEADLAAARARAGAEDRRVLVEWGTDWDRWCRMLHALEGSDPKIKRELLYEYDVVRVDVGRYDRNLELAAKLGAEPARGIPWLTILAADGTVVLNRAGFRLEAPTPWRPAYDPAKVLDLLVSGRAPRVPAIALLSEALSLAQADGKRVLLHFGSPGSREGRLFETWIAAPPADALLARDYVLRKIDVERTLGGKDLMNGFRRDGRKTLPWFAVLDDDGRALETSETEDGENVGFPTDPGEIAHLVEMIRMTSSRLGAPDLGALAASLEGFADRKPPPKPAPAEPAPRTEDGEDPSEGK
jgi:hypothetical protein